MYAYLARSASLKDMDFPIVSPVHVRTEPGERTILDLKTVIELPTTNESYSAFDEARQLWTPKPIFGKEGLIIINLEGRKKLSI